MTLVDGPSVKVAVRAAPAPSPEPLDTELAERLPGAVRAGLRYVRNEPALRAVLVRAGFFMVGGSAILALLPLVARQELGLGSEGYGLLLGCFGAGAVTGAALLPRFKQMASPNLLVGAADGDDAAVLRLDDERALVLTTDFFTPIVDDARDWGRIAAANILGEPREANYDAVPRVSPDTTSIGAGRRRLVPPAEVA